MSDKVSLREYIKRRDIVLIVLLAVTACLWWGWNLTHRDAAFVEVEYHGKLVGRYPMNDDRTVEIDHGITMEIRDGKVRMVRSTCRDLICVKQGWTATQPIICVPNELVIRVTGSEDEEMMITR